MPHPDDRQTCDSPAHSEVAHPAHGCSSARDQTPAKGRSRGTLMKNWVLRYDLVRPRVEGRWCKLASWSVGWSRVARAAGAAPGPDLRLSRTQRGHSLSLTHTLSLSLSHSNTHTHTHTHTATHTHTHTHTRTHTCAARTRMTAGPSTLPHTARSSPTPETMPAVVAIINGKRCCCDSKQCYNSKQCCDSK